VSGQRDYSQFEARPGADRLGRESRIRKLCTDHANAKDRLLDEFSRYLQQVGWRDGPMIRTGGCLRKKDLTGACRAPQFDGMRDPRLFSHEIVELFARNYTRRGD
jgi:hypothetical protein